MLRASFFESIELCDLLQILLATSAVVDLVSVLYWR